MTERINHAAEAMLCVKYAQSPSAGAPDVAAIHMAQAQVHATLALVEQQRIANLITLDEAYTLVAEDANAWQSERVMRTDVREGLGL